MRITSLLAAPSVCRAAVLCVATFAGSARAQGASPEAIAHNPSLAGPDPSGEFRGQSAKVKRPRGKLSGFEFRPVAIAMGLGGGGPVLHDNVEARERVGGVGGGQIDVRVAFPCALFVDVGIASGYAGDRGGSFHEVACSDFGGQCSSVESRISAVMPFFKTGLLQRLFIPQGRNAWQATLLGGIGYRGITLTREIENCVDCTTKTLDVNGGYFVSPELDLSYVVNDPDVYCALGLKLDYEHYLRGDIQSAVWLSAFVEFM